MPELNLEAVSTPKMNTRLPKILGIDQASDGEDNGEDCWVRVWGLGFRV